MFEQFDTPRYAGFWKRAAAGFLDAVILLPTLLVNLWLFSIFRLYPFYAFLPNVLFDVFFYVYLLHQYGGTPGKLIVGIRVTSVAGGPVTWAQAFLRHSPEIVFSTIGAVAGVGVLGHLSDAQFHSLSLVQLAQWLATQAPWLNTLRTVENVWIWSELIVLLTNKKRRALHDFLAGTVVVARRLEPQPPYLEPEPAVQ